MAILSSKTWSRHANPWSGWTRLLSYPLIFLAIWFHNWYGLLALAMWFVINPLIFTKPKNTRNWMSRGVLGEQLWTNKVHWDLNMGLNLFGIPLFFAALYFAYQNQFWAMIFAAAAVFILKLWFLDRMGFYYQSNKLGGNPGALH